MDIQHVEPRRSIEQRVRSVCLVEGCPCKDARIVSQRRAAFFAAWAVANGETADRVVPADLSWRISRYPAEI
jgi:hypothetical protein